ncbi:leucine-rich repeat-containing protein 15-like [Sitodiplosis mosellana]|uniref:leucine-rich repeat-containing protein 15-like n=1 Tax=Sitodiplosis mosellana TaxID=263140 RepID=UPI002444F160|nr:leucine-rich repeat-containing protein 15-like [Sitodiplosis mosellana]
MRSTSIPLILAVIWIGCDCAKNAINSCIYSSGKNVVTFICSDYKNERLFHASTTHRCDEGDVDLEFNKANIKTVDFHNCELQHIPRELYEEYGGIQVLNISHLGLKWLYLEEARRLVKLFASHNKLRMIPEHLGGIKVIDLSHNEIDDNASDISEFSRKNLFLESNKVFQLNLSYNQFSKLSAGIFGKFKNLRHLNMSHNRITKIEPKTLMHQTKLESLVLSYNLLITISNNIFPFQSKHLKSLFIEGNNLLQTMSGFTPSNYPNLVIINTKKIKVDQSKNISNKVMIVKH